MAKSVSATSAKASTGAQPAPSKAAPSKAAKAPAKAAKAAAEGPAKAPTRTSRTTAAKAAPAKAAAKAGPDSAPATTPPAAKKTSARRASAVTKTTSPPVPVGTDWSASELAEIRSELESQLAELRAEYDQAVTELNDMQNFSRDGAGDDQADTGTKTFEREQQLSIAHNRLDLMTQVEHAIERINAGTYGVCEGCGKSIAKARLQAFPGATLCVACKQREERR